MDFAVETVDSSDEDFGENLQLAERLRIHRGENKVLNGHRKKMLLDDQSSSSSSFEVRNDEPKASTSGTYATYNKKRQNIDKNAEPFANPKRTCLNTRSRKPHEFHHKKKLYNNGFGADNVLSAPINSIERNLYPDKIYEDLIHNSDKSGPSTSKHYSVKNIRSKKPKPIEDVTYIPSSNLDSYNRQTEKKYQDKNNKSESSDSDHPKQFLWRSPQKRIGESSRSVENETVAISEFIAPPVPSQFYRNNFHPSQSDNVVHYVDSASDEDSRALVTTGSLKGGRQSPDISQKTKKVVGRKVKKILDSDDSDDDDDDFPVLSRRKPILVFSSSDSEETDKRVKAVKKSSPSENLPSSSIPINGEVPKSKFTCHPPGESYRSACFAAGSCFEAVRSSTPPPFYNSRTSTKHCRNRKNSRSNSTTSEVSPVSYHPLRNNGATVRNRSRVGANERYTRRSGSPHPSSLPNSHTRMTRPEAAKSAKGRSLTGSYARRANLNLATTYPDLFDAEDSSEVEFFTANSYSDTETSAESFGGLRISAAAMNGENDVDQSIHIASSDDEISVVFSTGPSVRNAEQRRGTSRAIGRRHNRGSRRQLSPQEIISLSPDPVEQVRQLEDDERFARQLQAQFDAEVDPDYVPLIPDPVNMRDLMSPMFETDTEFEDNIELARRLYSPPAVTSSNLSPSVCRRGPRVNRVPTRYRSTTFLENLFHNNRRLDRNRRRLNNRDQRNQIARLFDSTIFPFMDIFSSEDSYETNLGLAELTGDVPRGLQRGEINRLPTRKFVIASITDSSASSSQVPHKRAELNKECQVCLSDYENGDTLRILPCFHEFHTPCIDPWLKINHTCPVCRVVVDLG